MTKAKKPAKKAKKGAYRLELGVNDLNYNVQADSLAEALGEIVSSSDFPFTIKTRVLINAQGKEGEYRWSVPVVLARRMFKMAVKKPETLELVADKLIGRLE